MYHYVAILCINSLIASWHPGLASGTRGHYRHGPEHGCCSGVVLGSDLRFVLVVSCFELYQQDGCHFCLPDLRFTLSFTKCHTGFCAFWGWKVLLWWAGSNCSIPEPSRCPGPATCKQVVDVWKLDGLAKLKSEIECLRYTGAKMSEVMLDELFCSKEKIKSVKVGLQWCRSMSKFATPLSAVHRCWLCIWHARFIESWRETGNSVYVYMLVTSAGWFSVFISI